MPLTAQDVRAAAEVHGELGPDYSDAVVQLRTWRAALAGAVAGSVVVGLPLTVIAAHALSSMGHGGRLAMIWVVLAAIYGLAAYRLRRR